MDISNVKPFDNSKDPRQAPQRPTGEHERQVGESTSGDAQPPSELPDSDGVTGSSHAEGGSIRDTADPKQTKDHAAATSRLAEFVEALRDKSGAPGTTRLAIDVDEQTYDTTFLVVDKDSGQVVREISDKEFLPLLRELVDGGGLMDSGGLMVDRSV